MKFEKLCKLDPAIAELKSKIEDLRKSVEGMSESDSFCAIRAWYAVNEAGEGFKSKLLRLAGHQRKSGPSELQTSEAYDVVYQNLFAEMPECRNCDCVPF